jgi:hypothetical protein
MTKWNYLVFWLAMILTCVLTYQGTQMSQSWVRSQRAKSQKARRQVSVLLGRLLITLRTRKKLKGGHTFQEVQEVQELQWVQEA